MRATPNENTKPDMVPLKALGQRILKLVDGRDEFIAENNIPPAFGNPSANWDRRTADFFKGYDRVASLNWPQVRYLRQRSQSYTGYSLLRFKNAAGFHALDPLPNYDTLLPDEPPEDLMQWWTMLKIHVPPTMLYKPRSVLGECGWWVGDNSDVLLNNDTVVYQERLTLLWTSGLFKALVDAKPTPRVLEIGGGFGALCNGLMDAMPQAEYWIVDLPESLLFSGLYLHASGHEVTTTDPAPGKIMLLPNYAFTLMDDKPFDLAINTLSMSELSEVQIRGYVERIAKLLGREGVFYEQNQDNTQIGMQNAEAVVREYFARGRRLGGPFPISQGHANLWANA